MRAKGKVVCIGLIQDWVTWQNQPNKYPFQLFTNVIKKLAPHPDEWIEIGEPTRVSVEDVRDIPTVKLPYGNVSVTQASAGMKRILGLAYPSFVTLGKEKRMNLSGNGKTYRSRSKMIHEGN